MHAPIESTSIRHTDNQVPHRPPGPTRRRSVTPVCGTHCTGDMAPPWLLRTPRPERQLPAAMVRSGVWGGGERGSKGAGGVPRRGATERQAERRQRRDPKGCLCTVALGAHGVRGRPAAPVRLVTRVRPSRVLPRPGRCLLPNPRIPTCSSTARMAYMNSWKLRVPSPLWSCRRGGGGGHTWTGDDRQWRRQEGEHPAPPRPSPPRPVPPRPVPPRPAPPRPVPPRPAPSRVHGPFRTTSWSFAPTHPPGTSLAQILPQNAPRHN
jgi:hypothetical protein